MNRTILLLLIFYLKGALSNSCEIHRTCRDCLRDASLCVWCASKTYNSDQRCKPSSYGSGNSSWCSDSLQNPESTVIMTKDDPFSSDPIKNVTQIKPQRYQLNLRPGQPKNFSFSFKWAEDYPVDIYFLFDSSNTMNTVRNQTSQQSENIYNTMLTMTKNVFMGMGTFVDKNMMPFTTNVVSNKSYSFRHHVNLTQEYKKFQEAVDAIEQGENRDSPEAGLDALAQVIACKEKIGWRKQSRKILVLMTDDLSHAAGDGKSAGIFKPYDGNCYTENNVYVNEEIMDYPSVSMIYKLARDNNVILIFAVPHAMNTVYSNIIDYIPGSKIISLGTDHADEIVTQLKKIYEEITTKIQLNVNMQADSYGSARSKNFLISFDPDCTKDISACKVTTNGIKNITGTIKLLEYEGYDKATIDVAIKGIAEKLTLDIDVINDCECKNDVELASTYCNGEKRECGLCQCNEPRYGDKCQCSRDINSHFTSGSESTCQAANITKPCSGRGVCSCGACSCQPGYAGPYCECFLKNCPMDKEHVVCGGHGECQCDETCKCEPGWSGDACECYDTEKLCMTANKKVCNNRGKCDCGSCACDPIAEWDSRKDFDKYCVISPCDECHNLQCKILTDCAVCTINEGNNCNCSFVHSITIVEKLSDNLNDSDANPDWNVCQKVRVDMGCYTNFTYKYDKDEYKIHLMLQKDKNCAENYYIFGAIFLICVLLVGLLTLLGWKLITYIRDRNEYLQFMKDHVPDNVPCANPLYEPATTEFRNPAFGKRSIQYR